MRQQLAEIDLVAGSRPYEPERTGPPMREVEAILDALEGREDTW